MDHIAHELNKDPVEVRRVNLIQEGDPIVIPAPYETFTGPNLIPEMLEEMEASAQYSARKAAVEEFNKASVPAHFIHSKITPRKNVQVS